MMSSALSMEEFDRLQTGGKLLFQGVLEKANTLQLKVDSLLHDNKILLEKYNMMTYEFEELRRLFENSVCTRCGSNKLLVNLKKRCTSERNDANVTCAVNPSGVAKTVVSGGSATEEEIAQEVEALSSLPLDTQFVPDVQIIEETMTKEPTSDVRSRRPILDDFFGAAPTQLGENYCHASAMLNEPVTPRKKSTILADESPTILPKQLNAPQCYVPETGPQHVIENTPEKDSPCKDDLNRRMCQNSDVRLTPAEKLFYTKRPKLDLDLSCLVSPSKRDSQPLSQLTPPSKLYSQRKGKSPRRNTPKKQLNKSHLTDIEITTSGIHKMKQTQLNLDYFLTTPKVPKTLIASEAFTSTPKVLLSNEQADANNTDKNHSPLQSLENSPDFNETNLSVSAINRIAQDVCLPDNMVLSKGVDRNHRLPDQMLNPRCKEVRRQLPGRSCSCCAAYFDAVGENDGSKQQALDKLSRHKNILPQISDTPPGFWRPMITQTPDPS